MGVSVGECWTFSIDGIGTGGSLFLGLARLDPWRPSVHRRANLRPVAIAFPTPPVNSTGRLPGVTDQAPHHIPISLGLAGAKEVRS